MDNLTAEQRHYNMSRIKAKDTKPEVLVRSYLFRRGLRFRKNDKLLPGHPDVVLPKYKTVIFINGCFWHGHENCRYAVIPKTNTEFWTEKINANRIRDELEKQKLQDAGWKVIIIWECMLKRTSQENTLESLYGSICDTGK